VITVRQRSDLAQEVSEDRVRRLGCEDGDHQENEQRPDVVLGVQAFKEED
jgi:hypothetical protein